MRWNKGNEIYSGSRSIEPWVRDVLEAGAAITLNDQFSNFND